MDDDGFLFGDFDVLLHDLVFAAEDFVVGLGQWVILVSGNRLKFCNFL